jgi:ABC-type nitrate/sulfonate/bicarbonate transport system substrate-binding protein
MGRIRWGNVAVTLAVVALAVYGSLAVLGLARPGELLRLGSQPSADDQLTAAAPPTAAPAAEPTDAAVVPTDVPAPPPAEAPAPPAATQLPPLAPVMPAPTLATDNGFQSEVPVPESQGNFPLGYITVAFDKEFPPYSPVVLLYQQHLAEKRGLGIRFVPFDIDDKNRISEFRRADLLQHGGFDVLLTTMNSYALWGGPNVGKVTAVIGESAGADKAVVQASSIQTFNDLDGKSVSYSDGSVSEYLLYYMLRAGGVPVDHVIRFGQENLNQAVRRFDDHQSHAVVGWTSSDLDQALQRPDSKVLMTSDQFRVTTDVIVSGDQALATRREALAAFHDAWFEATKMTFEHPEQAAAGMAAWNGSWTGVQTTQDLTDALKEFAQATLADNEVVMSDQNRPTLESRFKDAQAVWQSGGRQVTEPVADAELKTVFDPSFVQHASQDNSLVSTQPPVNPTFHLTAKPEVKGLTADEQSRLQAVAVLNVHELRFDQGSATLTPEARQAIESAVIPVLRNTVGTYLKIDGSAGWPEKAGLDENVINSLSFERARAVQDYIIKFGIPVERLVLGTTMPRCRECTDPAQVQQDNRVDFTLATL